MCAGCGRLLCWRFGSLARGSAYHCCLSHQTRVRERGEGGGREREGGGKEEGGEREREEGGRGRREGEGRRKEEREREER